MTRTAFASVTGKENLPSISVTVPVEVPFTTILTPIRGSFVLSTIVPVIVLVCCCGAGYEEPVFFDFAIDTWRSLIVYSRSVSGKKVIQDHIKCFRIDFDVNSFF